MRIAIAGSSGLIGTELVDYFGALGHRVHRLVRTEAPSEDTDILWDPARGMLPAGRMEGFDAVICLSGAGIADARWTEDRKRILRKSRVDSVRLLADAIAACQDPPDVFICASAIGYYGADRETEVLTEESPAGGDFIGDMCKEWEDAARPAVDTEIRVVNLRIGVVLTPKGGALKRMLIPFKLGLGASIASGRQYMSWIALDDVVSIFDFVLQTDELVGPVNALSPNPTTNRDFAKTLGSALHRPALGRIPKFLLRAAVGEMEEMLSGSVRAFPRKLEAAGFHFRYAELRPALEAMLHRK